MASTIDIFFYRYAVFDGPVSIKSNTAQIQDWRCAQKNVSSEKEVTCEDVKSPIAPRHLQHDMEWYHTDRDQEVGYW